MIRNNSGKPFSFSRRDILKGGLALGLAAGLPAGLFSGGCVNRKPKGPNILLLSLDTTRADRLGCYGYQRVTSPNLDRLALESVFYTRAISPSSWTLPSHASLFTGKFVSSHGVENDPNGPLDLTSALEGPWKGYRVRGLNPKEITLAQVLKRWGYTTGAVVGGPWMKKIFGLANGFDYYDDDEISTVNGRLADQVTSSAVKWLERTTERPFFLFLNYFDPHDPYETPKRFYSKFWKEGTAFKGEESLRLLRSALYDSEILYMDFYIGKILEKLKKDRLYDRTWIIVTADHGELLGEHGHTGHGYYLYQEEIHVPLFMKYPKGENSPRIQEGWVQSTDILPAICERLEISLPPGVQGSAPPHLTHPIISETYPLEFASQDGSWRCLFEGDYKVIWNSKGNHLLFNLKRDPREKKNLTENDSARVKRMTVQLNKYIEGLPRPLQGSPEGKVDEETIKALKSLGYLE